MWSRSEFAKFIVERERQLIRALDEGFKPDAASEAPAAPEPEPRKLRQSEQKGIDMNDLLRAADAERRRRPLPRKPSWG